MNNLSLNHKEVKAMFPKRNPETHKGNYGKILLICGSRGYTGAPALAAMGALRCGAGLVYLAVPECIYSVEATKLLEPIVLPMPDREDKFSSASTDPLLKLLPQMDAVLIGPGIGISEDIFELVKAILDHYYGPVVLDADGINVLQHHTDILRRRTAPTILTPHLKEFSRIGGQMHGDRIHNAKTFASETETILLLKGNRSIITDGVSTYINTTGNPGMAVGGSGDILAGMIVSLLGQGFEPLKAAACSAWLHGAAGDVCASEIGQYGMIPGDMLEVLPRLIK